MSRILQILLVEDSLSDRFLALEALAEAKILNNVHTVEDGIEALDFVRRAGRFSQLPGPISSFWTSIFHGKMEERFWRN